MLAFRLQRKHRLKAGTRVLFYFNCEEELRKFFLMASLFIVQTLRGFFLLLVCLHNIQMTGDFINDSKRSLKCILLHNSNQYRSIFIGQFVTLKKNCDNIKFVLKRLKYCVRQWFIYVDLKMVNFLLVQQGGPTKYPCFLCYWGSKVNEEHWIRKEWLVKKYNETWRKKYR